MKKLPKSYFASKMRSYYSQNPEKFKERARTWRKKNRERSIEINRLSRERQPEKQIARMELIKFIRRQSRRGIKVRPDKCNCGNLRPEAHHPDYSKPLEVMWLCKRCHTDLHLVS